MAFFLIVAGVARADWRFDVETGTVYDSNLSNSNRASDRKDDWAWQSALEIGNGFQFSRDLRLNLACDLREQVWARFAAFDHVTPGGNIGLRYRFGLGRLAPWGQVEDHFGYAAFKDSGRNGFENRFRVRGGLGLTERLSLEAAYTFDNFEAHDPFWSLSGHSGSLHLAYDATPSLQLAFGYSYRDGEVVSYALPPRPDLVALAAARQSEGSFGRPIYTAYRLRGVTHAISASAGYTLSEHVSVIVTYEFRNTSHGPLDYVNHLVEAKFAFVY